MTVLEIVKKLIFKTIFTGKEGDFSEFPFNRELLTSISVKLKDWSSDTIMSGSVSQDRKSKISFSMPLWSGGYITNLSMEIG
jgi:hypothetical protein